jgi:hypothetical protein
MWKAVFGLHYKKKEQKKSGQLEISNIRPGVPVEVAQAAYKAKGDRAPRLVAGKAPTDQLYNMARKIASVAWPQMP